MIIKFSDDEMDLIKIYAKERQKAKKGISAVDKRVGGHGNIKTHKMGIMGEWAVCKALVIPFHNEPVKDGEHAEGIHFRGQSVQAKNLQKYLVFNTLDDFTKDIAVLVNPVKDRPNTVRIIGWITKDEFAHKCTEIDLQGRGTRWHVKFMDMRDLTEFLQPKLHMI